MCFNALHWPKMVNFVFDRLKIGFNCVLCGRAGGATRDLCDGCERLLERRIRTDRSGQLTAVCLECGDEWTPHNVRTRLTQGQGSITESGKATPYERCHQCQSDSSPFSSIVAPYRYAFPLDKMIHRLKYRNQRQYARLLGSLLAANVSHRDELPDVLVPVPMHSRRMQSRGYNQAADIARWCAQELPITYRPDAVVRVVNTDSLAGLSRAARQHRILGAFEAAQWVAGMRVAIVDDVLTTGSTARELARELYDTGALSVELWVLARTSSDR